MKEGIVTIGFSKPYVALLSESGGNATYSGGMRLARGVSVSVNANTSDSNPFYADNIEAENDPGTFVDGTFNLEVDGLLIAAEKLIMGTAEAGDDGWMAYNESQKIPYVGIGFIVKGQSDGVEYYKPMILAKAAFDYIPVEAETQESTKNYQTQELTGKLARLSVGDRTWKYVGEWLETEAAAETKITTKLNITNS